MIIKIDFQSDEALYMQLRNQIILGIATSVIQEGDALPSVRQLADDIGILNHGCLLFEGTLDELKQNAKAKGYPTDNLEDTFLALIEEDNIRGGGVR